LASVPRHNPESPLPDATQEAYVQARAKGMGPAQAAEATGLPRYRLVERQAAFTARLKLLSGEVTDDPTLTLQFLVTELKRTVSGARSAGQFRNANEALSQLAELYERHPELRGDAPKKEAPAAPATREERRAAHRGRLAVVPEAAADE
jgi:hypothetical protein